jgi:hypothetical protein
MQSQTMSSGWWTHGQTEGYQLPISGSEEHQHSIAGFNCTSWQSKDLMWYWKCFHHSWLPWKDLFYCRSRVWWTRRFSDATRQGYLWLAFKQSHIPFNICCWFPKAAGILSYVIWLWCLYVTVQNERQLWLCLHTCGWF